MKICTNETLFEHAITAEKAAQDFYFGLTKRFSYSPEVSDLWKSMQKDEIQHARELMNIRDSLTPKQLRLPADPTILGKAKEVLKFPVNNNLDSIRTTNDAYQLAYELENSDVNTVFEFLRCFISFNKRDKFVFSEIEDHLQKLVEFPQIFGDVEWRKIVQVTAISLPI